MSKVRRYLSELGSLRLNRKSGQKSSVFPSIRKIARRRVPTKVDALEQLVQLGLPVGTVLDVGVRTGTPALIKIYPDKPHILFEPIAEFVPKISERYSSIQHEIVTVAVGDQDGEINMEVESVRPKESITHSRMSQDEPPTSSARKVACARLDTIVPAKNRPEPYLLKIDVDGAEMQVLEGSKAILQKCSAVVIEATVATLSERLKFLNRNGFELFDIVDLCYYDNNLYQLDAVLVRSDFLAGLPIAKIRPFEPSKWYNFRAK